MALTLHELAGRRSSLAASLEAHGVAEGDRVVVLAPNSTEFLDAVLAAIELGAVAVPLNTRLSRPEIAWLVDDSGAEVVLVGGRLDEHVLGVGAVVVALDELGSQASSNSPAPASPAPDRVAVQMYTSGTTGRPKGALLSHRGIDATIANVAREFQLDPTSVYLGLLPMFHISGLGTALATLAHGGTVAIPSGTSPSAIVADVEAFEVTHVNLVPTLIAGLCEEPRAAERMRSVRHVMYGAAPSGSDLIERAMRLMPTAEFHHGYGLTECTGGVAYEPAACWQRGDLPAPSGRVGAPVPDAQVRIVDPSDGTDVPGGRAGEIWVRSPQNIAGYWRRPDADRELYLEPGWLRTGDVGSWNGSFLQLHDRLRDMIITGGENVYPAEVERALDEHPAVAESAVYGMPDTHWGERVCAAVRLRPGMAATPEELIGHTRLRLAGFKCPKQIRVVDELPKGPTGKILRRRLADDEAASAGSR